jgi:hypothetical protein
MYGFGCGSKVQFAWKVRSDGHALAKACLDGSRASRRHGIARTVLANSGQAKNRGGNNYAVESGH